jgi:hypothetical protein
VESLEDVAKHQLQLHPLDPEIQRIGDAKTLQNSGSVLAVYNKIPKL